MGPMKMSGAASPVPTEKAPRRLDTPLCRHPVSHEHAVPPPANPLSRVIYHALLFCPEEIPL